jgi:tRNA(Ile)-lysidine synthase
VKLSDFFVANKFSIAEKEKVWLMVDAQDQIVWIIGQRIADQNRLKAATKRVFTAILIH